MIGQFFFSTLIFYKDIPNSKKLNQHLLKNIKKLKKNDEKGMIRSNLLGWHSAINLQNKKEYNQLTEELFKMQQQIYKTEGYHPNTEAVLESMWANVNYKYSYNKNHVHPDSQWSGVYYVKCPNNCGDIWFTDPCGERRMHTPIIADESNTPSHSWKEVHYKPTEGRILMFPSWLAHEVSQNMSDLKGEKGWRVSISFNFKQRWKYVK